MIRTQGIEKRYGKFQALHPLDLHVRRGEVFGFLGPNGAGKTTTIRILAGILPATSGSVLIDDLDIAAFPEEVRRRVGYIPDRPYLYEKLTATEFLDYIGGIYGMDPAVTRRTGARLVEEYGLVAFADELIESYSHGMKQRLVLCAALIHDPKVFIVDEPMVGLDPQGARHIKDTFRRLAREGRTIFLSTHTLTVAEEVCDRIGIIHKGRVVALGTLEELRRTVAKGDTDLESIFLGVIGEPPDLPPEDPLP